MQNLFFLVLIGFIMWVVAAGNSVDQAPLPTVIQTGSVPASICTSAQTSSSQTSVFNNSSASFSCDGRQYCSEMTSRAEAVFFIRNCPNTKMDGDNDGDPCENDSRF